MPGHKFTRKEIREAEHDFAENIKRYFGSVWRIPWNGEYIGVSWDCHSPLSTYGGLWRLCQEAIHKGARRAAGRIEVREAGEVLRFILFYSPKDGDIIYE